jgi:hypothetical protein
MLGGRAGFDSSPAGARDSATAQWPHVRYRRCAAAVRALFGRRRGLAGTGSTAGRGRSAARRPCQGRVAGEMVQGRRKAVRCLPARLRRRPPCPDWLGARAGVTTSSIARADPVAIVFPVTSRLQVGRGLKLGRPLDDQSSRWGGRSDLLPFGATPYSRIRTSCAARSAVHRGSPPAHTAAHGP